MKKFNLFSFVIIVLASVSLSFSSDFYVDDINGSDLNDGLSWSSSFSTIDKAISEASLTPEPDNVYVAAGNYIRTVSTGAVNLISDFNMYGGYPSGGGARDLFANRTIIEYTTPITSTQQKPLITIINKTNVTIDGFEIRGGFGANSLPSFSFSRSGGITVFNSTSITIKNCLIHDNNTSDDNIDGCTFFGACPPGNSYGGGLFVYNSSGTIKNNAFYGKLCVCMVC